MKTLLLLVCAPLAFSAHAFNYSTCKNLKVGDVVTQYRHWNHATEAWNDYPSEEDFGAKLRILAFTKDAEGFPAAKVQLVAGIIRSSASGNHHPGNVDIYSSSAGYRTANPKSYLQFCDEYRKVK